MEDKKNKENVEKVSSDEEEAKLKKANEKKLEKQIIIMFIVLGLLLVSFLGAYELFKPKPYFSFEGYHVYKTRLQGINEDFYVIPVTSSQKQGNEEVVLRHDPRTLDLKIIEADSLLNIKNIGRVWVTMSPEIKADGIIAQNQVGMFTSTIGLKTEYGLTTGNSLYPEISCDNATETTRIVMIELSNETRVYEDGYCIIVHGENYAKLVESADSLVYYWLKRITVEQ